MGLDILLSALAYTFIGLPIRRLLRRVLTARYCPRCNATLRADFSPPRFCSSCGAVLS